MRVFISYARDNAESGEQLADALRRHNIETRSSRDLAPGEDWRRVADEEGAKADAVLFLLRAGDSADQRLQAEWRALLRSDWEGNKTLIPIVKMHDGPPEKIPPFLSIQRVVYTANFDDAVERIEYLVQHPDEAIDPVRYAEGEADMARRREELKEYALALKEEEARHARDEATPQ